MLKQANQPAVLIQQPSSYTTELFVSSDNQDVWNPFVPVSIYMKGTKCMYVIMN